MEALKVIGIGLLVLFGVALVFCWAVILWVVSSWIVDDVIKLAGFPGLCLKILIFTLLGGFSSRIRATSKENK